MRKELEGRVVKFLKEQDPKFIEACNKAGVPPTRRQASKWLNGMGKAWKEGRTSG